MGLKRLRLRKVLLCSLLAFALIGSTTVFEVAEGSPKRILTVPFVSQGSEPICLPAALTMVLNYWGKEVSLEHLVREVGDYPFIDLKKIRQIVDSYNLSYMWNYGWTVGDIMDYVDEGVPVIVEHWFSEAQRTGHARVVVGYDDANKTIITHDPAVGSFYEIPYERFNFLWANLNGVYVIEQFRHVAFDVSPRDTAISIKVDGRSYAYTDLPITLKWVRGTFHYVEVDREVTVGSGSRRVLDQWNDGYTSVLRLIVVNKSLSYTVNYKEQFYLQVVSEHNNAEGEGWYDRGSMATFSVVPRTSASGLRGVIGVGYVFERWSGDVAATTPVASILMNSPRTVVAYWRTDYTVVYALIVILAAIVLAGSAVILKRTLSH